MSPEIDLTIFSELRQLQSEEDPDFLQGLFAAFIETCERELERMEKGLEGGNAEWVRESAHTLKSSSANFGAMRMSALCREIEQLGRGDKLGGVREKFRVLRECYSLSRGELAGLIGEKR